MHLLNSSVSLEDIVRTNEAERDLVVRKQKTKVMREKVSHVVEKNHLAEKFRMAFTLKD